MKNAAVSGYLAGGVGPLPVLDNPIAEVVEARLEKTTVRKTLTVASRSVD